MKPEDWIDLMIQVVRFVVTVITLVFDRMPPRRKRRRPGKRKSSSR